MSFINEYLIEVDEFPIFEGGMHTVKDYFFYNSNTKNYDHRNLIVPVSKVLNNNDMPSEDIIKELINKNVPIMNRIIDLKDETETWIFNTKSLEEIKK